MTDIAFDQRSNQYIVTAADGTTRPATEDEIIEYQRLFDLAEYHREPEPDPNKPSVARCVELIDDARADGDLVWLDDFVHWMFFKGCRIYSEQEYGLIFAHNQKAIEDLS